MTSVASAFCPEHGFPPSSPPSSPLPPHTAVLGFSRHPPTNRCSGERRSTWAGPLEERLEQKEEERDVILHHPAHHHHHNAELEEPSSSPSAVASVQLQILAAHHPGESGDSDDSRPPAGAAASQGRPSSIHTAEQQQQQQHTPPRRRKCTLDKFDCDSLERAAGRAVHPALSPSEPRVLSILIETHDPSQPLDAEEQDEDSKSFLRKLFPWCQLYSFISLITFVQLVLFITTLIVGETMFDGAFIRENPMGGPSAETLRYMGGIYEPSIRKGMLHLLITPLFLHAGVIHFVFNVYFQARLGYGLERRFGTRTLIFIYFHTGLCAVLMSALEKDDHVTVGSSGALFGLMGADLSFILYNKSEVLFWKLECVAIAAIILINFLMGWFPGVDNFAHLGGLLSGLPLGIAATPLVTPKANAAIWRLLSWTFAIGLLIGLAVIFVSHDLEN